MFAATCECEPLTSDLMPSVGKWLPQRGSDGRPGTVQAVPLAEGHHLCTTLLSNTAFNTGTNLSSTSDTVAKQGPGQSFS